MPFHSPSCLARVSLISSTRDQVTKYQYTRANRTNGHLSLLLSRFTLIEQGTFKFLNDLSRVMLEEREEITFLLPLMRHANRTRQVHDCSVPRILSKIMIISKYQD